MKIYSYSYNYSNFWSLIFAMHLRKVNHSVLFMKPAVTEDVSMPFTAMDFSQPSIRPSISLLTTSSTMSLRDSSEEQDLLEDMTAPLYYSVNFSARRQIKVKFILQLFSGRFSKFNKRHYVELSPESNSNELRSTSGSPTGVSLSISNGYKSSEDEIIRRMRVDDFEILQVIGTGTCGSVFEVQYKPTSKILALKIISKDNTRIGDPATVLKEQIALKMVRGCPSFLQLVASFHDTANYYLVTEYHAAGDLEAEIIRLGHISPQRTRFYAAEIVLGLEFLHGQGVMHRDLKPGNILLDNTGHIVIADLSLARIFNRDEIQGEGYDDPFQAAVDFQPRNIDEQPWHTNTPCGSPNYMAPEVFSGHEYTFSADIWSLGITTYDMLFGSVPWHHEDTQILFQTILRDPVPFNPANQISQVQRDFLRRLLCKNPPDRMDIKEMKEHMFFSAIDWDAVRNRQTPAAYVPHGRLDSTPEVPEITFGEHYNDDNDPLPEYAFCCPLGEASLADKSTKDPPELLPTMRPKAGRDTTIIDRRHKTFHSQSPASISADQAGLIGCVTEKLPAEIRISGPLDPVDSPDRSGHRAQKLKHKIMKHFRRPRGSLNTKFYM